jgi:hypothetical protein
VRGRFPPWSSSPCRWLDAVPVWPG